MARKPESVLATELKLLLAMLCWGLSFIAIKIAFRGYGPIALVTLRLGIVVLVLGGSLALQRGRGKGPRGRDLLGLAFLGFLNPFLAFLLESFGMLDTSASIASLVLSTVPLLTPFAAYVAWRERVRLRNVLGLAISFGGLALIILWGAGPAEFSLLGLSLLVVAVAIAVIYGIAAKNMAARHPPLTVVTYQQAFGFLFYLPLFLIFTDRSLLPAGGAGAESLLAILFLAIFPSALAYTLYVGGLERLGPSRTNAFINLSPVITALASRLVLGESLGLVKLFGIAVTIAGVFIAQGGRKAETS